MKIFKFFSTTGWVIAPLKSPPKNRWKTGKNNIYKLQQTNKKIYNATKEPAESDSPIIVLLPIYGDSDPGLSNDLFELVMLL